MFGKSRQPEYALPQIDILVSISSHYDRYKSILSETPGFQTWISELESKGYTPVAAKDEAKARLKRHFLGTAQSIHRFKPTLSPADVAYEASLQLFDELHEEFDLELLRDESRFPVDSGIPSLVLFEYRLNRGLLRVHRAIPALR